MRLATLTTPSYSTLRLNAPANNTPPQKVDAFSPSGRIQRQGIDATHVEKYLLPAVKLQLKEAPVFKKIRSFFDKDSHFAQLRGTAKRLKKALKTKDFSQLDALYLVGTNLEYAILDKANLFKANLEGANLQNAYLRGANLEYANLKKADLGFANLTDAYLRKVNLEQADLHFTKFTGANLSGSNLKGTDLRYTYLDGAEFGSSKTSKKNEPLAVFYETIIRGKSEEEIPYLYSRELLASFSRSSTLYQQWLNTVPLEAKQATESKYVPNDKTYEKVVRSKGWGWNDQFCV